MEDLLCRFRDITARREYIEFLQEQINEHCSTGDGVLAMATTEKLILALQERNGLMQDYLDFLNEKLNEGEEWKEV